jgi:hypothetical protein
MPTKSLKELLHHTSISCSSSVIVLLSGCFLNLAIAVRTKRSYNKQSLVDMMLFGSMDFVFNHRNNFILLIVTII